MCVEGTFTENPGSESAGDCVNCEAGYFCSREVIIDGYACEERSVRPNGQLTVTSNSNDCPPGTECPRRSSAPTNCDPGYYQENDKAEECVPCAAGIFCTTERLETPTQCVDGQYCQYDDSAGIRGSVSCAAGFYLDTVDLWASDIVAYNMSAYAKSQCRACTRRYYCPANGAQAITQNSLVECQPGKYCDISMPTVDGADNCPAGFECPLQT